MTVTPLMLEDLQYFSGNRNAAPADVKLTTSLVRRGNAAEIYAAATRQDSLHLFTKTYGVKPAYWAQNWDCWCALARGITRHRHCRDITCKGNVNPGVDHLRAWRYGRQLVAITYEPYALWGDALTGLAQLAESFKFDVQIDSQNTWHYPGRTLHVEVWRAGERERLRAARLEVERLAKLAKAH